jgi:hypothetical protein
MVVPGLKGHGLPFTCKQLSSARCIKLTSAVEYDGKRWISSQGHNASSDFSCLEDGWSTSAYACRRQRPHFRVSQRGSAVCGVRIVTQHQHTNIVACHFYKSASD